jgi:murein DD-endopeptidase MepM/ murein hydrolase activator NlpD
MRAWLLVGAGLMGVACGGGSTPSAPAPGPGTGTGALAGTVTSRVTRLPLSGIRVEVVSGPDAGRAADTDARGAYRLERLSATQFDVRASGTGREPLGATASGPTLDLAMARTPCGAVGCGAQPADCNEALPLLSAPFQGSFRPSNQFDHTRPQVGFSRPNDGTFVRWCGGGGSYDGHNGWDWPMPEGTLVLSAGPGQVLRATSEAPFFCPFLNRQVSGLYVQVAHVASQGESIVTEYLHLSEQLVTVGQTVTPGQPIGRSGNTDCSTGPHLHFAVYRQFGNGGQAGRIAIDPFGWQGSGPDPWAADAEGASSPWLWLGMAPRSAVAGPAIREYHNVPPPES